MKKLLLHTRIRLQRNITLVFVVVVLTIILFSRLILDDNNTTRKSEQLVRHTYDISKNAENIRSILAESESATRGFLITHDPRWRTMVRQDHSKVQRLLGQVEKQLIDTIQRHRLAGLRTIVNEQIGYQRDVIDRDSLIVSSLNATMRYEGPERKTSRAVNDGLDSFISRQNVLLQQRTQSSLSARNHALATVIIGTAIVFFFITGTLLKLNSDIRRRKRAERVLHEREKKYRRLIEDAGVTIFTCDFGGTFTYVSERCMALTGYHAAELTGKSFSLLVSADWLQPVTDEYKEQLRQLWEETSIEFVIQTRNGQEKWVEQHAVLLYDDHHSPIGYQCVVKDITEKKEAALLAKKSETELQALLNSMHEGFIMVNPFQEILLINRRAKEDIECPGGRKIFPGMELLPLLSEEKKEIVRQHIEKAFEGQPVSQESFYQSAQGMRRVIANYSPVYGENGNVTAVTIITHNYIANRAAGDDEVVMLAADKTVSAISSVIDERKLRNYGTA